MYVLCGYWKMKETRDLFVMSVFQPHTSPFSSSPTYSQTITVSLPLLEAPAHSAPCAPIMLQAHMEGLQPEKHSQLPPTLPSLLSREQRSRGWAWLSSSLSHPATPSERHIPSDILSMQESTCPDGRPGVAWLC